MKRRIEALKPILTAHLFPKIDGVLVELLRSLAPEDWEKKTVSPKCQVMQVAAHSLDTSMRGGSFWRSGCGSKSPGLSCTADFTAVIERLSTTRVIIYLRLA